MESLVSAWFYLFVSELLGVFAPHYHEKINKKEDVHLSGFSGNLATWKEGEVAEKMWPSLKYLHGT